MWMDVLPAHFICISLVCLMSGKARRGVLGLLELALHMVIRLPKCRSPGSLEEQ